MPDPIETNRPPFVPDETLVSPTAPTVTVNFQCLAEAPEFVLPVSDLDVDQVIEAAFFLDYDFGNPSPASLLGGRQRLSVTGEIRRDDARFDSLESFQPSLLNKTVATLEVFVLEADAFDPDGEPLLRGLQDCTAEGAPADCIFSTPLTRSWTLEIIDNVGECP